jgi:antitoxin component YwqK of YwqJK toxin-antitoxin module
LDFGEEKEVPVVEESALDRKQKIKELELKIETLQWENSRLSLKLKSVNGASLVRDKVTGLWHFDVERDPFSGRASEVFPDGSPRAEADFHMGKKDGMERFWWPNGNLKEQGQWFDGKANGVFREWDEQGKPLKVVRYKNGQIIEVILEEG